MSARRAAGAKSAGATQRYAALLRGVNVGGKNKLRMADLVAVCEAAGCTDVATYIQSGNATFAAPPSLAARLPSELARRIAEGFGLAVPVVLRSAQELEQAAASNPFLAPGADTDALHVMFLADVPAPSAVGALDARRSPPDEFRVIGREVFLRCPGGVARTRLTNAYFDAKLSTVSTSRNWRTVLTLLEMARGAPGLR